MSAINCICCNKLVEAHKSITCVICKNSFNHLCVDLSTSEIRTIKSKKSFSWTCSTCADTAGTLNELRSLIVSLKQELQDLKGTLNSQKSENHDINFEDVVQEVSERNARKCNLVIFGLQESPQNSAAQHRLEHDTNGLSSIFSFISPETILGEVKPIRLGKYDPSRTSPRPIKIKLQNEGLVHDLIRNAKKLKDSAQFKGVRISLDRTPRQIAAYKSVKAELDKKIANGNSNLKIKYVGGSPKIVPLN